MINFFNFPIESLSQERETCPDCNQKELIKCGKATMCFYCQTIHNVGIEANENIYHRLNCPECGERNDILISAKTLIDTLDKKIGNTIFDCKKCGKIVNKTIIDPKKEK